MGPPQTNWLLRRSFLGSKPPSTPVGEARRRQACVGDVVHEVLEGGDAGRLKGTTVDQHLRNHTTPRSSDIAREMVHTDRDVKMWRVPIWFLYVPIELFLGEIVTGESNSLTPGSAWNQGAPVTWET